MRPRPYDQTASLASRFLATRVTLNGDVMTDAANFAFVAGLCTGVGFLTGIGTGLGLGFGVGVGVDIGVEVGVTGAGVGSGALTTGAGLDGTGAGAGGRVVPMFCIRILKSPSLTVPS